MAHPTKDKFECMEKCGADENCKSATFNGPTSVNPNICVLAYGDPAEKNGTFISKNGSDLATAPRCCHCPCDRNSKKNDTSYKIRNIKQWLKSLFQ